MGGQIDQSTFNELKCRFFFCTPFVPHIFKVSSLVRYWMVGYVSADVSMMRSATLKTLQQAWIDAKVSESWKAAPFTG